jgi:hypothetical protein
MRRGASIARLARGIEGKGPGKMPAAPAIAVNGIKIRVAEAYL